MNEKEKEELEHCARIIQSAIDTWKNEGWSNDDMIIGQCYMAKLLLHLDGYPIGHPKFPEVLRAVANILEIKFKI